MAREALWRAGLDFDHGTGHGVGVYLSVHEGPQRLSKTDATVLEPGMILSNEPGYYAAGRFGIRIENLVVVRERAVAGADRPTLGFETISFAPIDLRLVDKKLMNARRDRLARRLPFRDARQTVAAGRPGDAQMAQGGDAAAIVVCGASCASPELIRRRASRGKGGGWKIEVATPIPSASCAGLTRASKM